MVHFGKVHLVEKETLERLNTVIMVGMIGSGLAACAIGAFIYDVGRLFSAW